MQVAYKVHKLVVIIQVGYKHGGFKEIQVKFYMWSKLNVKYLKTTEME